MLSLATDQAAAAATLSRTVTIVMPQPTTVDSEDFISAMPDEGVYRETQNFWETEYREVAGFFASSANTTERVVAVQYLRDQIGEPYLWDSSKTAYSKWYCSKLPYVAYEKKADLNIDTDGGYWVFPDDIAEDNDMDLFMSSEN